MGWASTEVRSFVLICSLDVIIDMTIGSHGTAVLEKLLPLAHAHNLRIVSVYRRGYSPSSEFREDELAGIGSQKKIEEVEPFFRAQGAEIAAFLVKFATEQRIPVVDSDPDSPTTGGIALIGWSLGGIHVLTLLAYLDELPEDTQSTLRKYLHTILSHGGSAFHLIILTHTSTHSHTPFSDANAPSLGIPYTPVHNMDLWNETDERKRFDGFFDWVTAHYIHKSVSSENNDDLEFENPSQDIPRSLHEISYEQRAKYTDFHPFSHGGCDGKLLFCDLTAFAALTKRALFDKVRATKSPNVRVRYMSSGTSAGALIWPLWRLRKCAESPEAVYGSGAERARDIKFITQTEGNHFIFWEDPEKAIQQYSVAINL
jgi:pimeloyl-ACP methyl ester carboxylesterase